MFGCILSLRGREVARDEAELGIIAGGREEYVKSLRSQCEREVAQLQSQRDSKAVRQQFVDRIRKSPQSLF